MAEIRVEPRRRSMKWLWTLIVLAVIAGLVYYALWYRNG
jgi:Na+-transporting NADH:ubiquinone oxidoreductase subunit NqrB